MHIIPASMALSPQQIRERLAEQHPDAIEGWHTGKHPCVHVSAARWIDVATFLKQDAELMLDWLRCLTAIDYAADGKLCVAYDLWSSELRHDFSVKVLLPRENPRLESVVHLWKAANWHEREAYDLLGVVFDGHPDLRRILLADDWEGYPLRKDYVFPREYHGIPGSVELDWQQKPA